MGTHGPGRAPGRPDSTTTWSNRSSRNGSRRSWLGLAAGRTRASRNRCTHGPGASRAASGGNTAGAIGGEAVFQAGPAPRGPRIARATRPPVRGQPRGPRRRPVSPASGSTLRRHTLRHLSPSASTEPVPSLPRASRSPGSPWPPGRVGRPPGFIRSPLPSPARGHLGKSSSHAMA